MSTPYRENASPALGPYGALFDHYKEAKNRKLPGWAYPLFIGCAVFTASLLFVMWIKTIWDLEQLERPKMSIDLAVAPPPPPPPPPPPGGAKPHETIITPKKLKVKDIVQPVKVEKQEQKVETTETGTGSMINDVYDPNSTCDTCTGDTIGAPPPPPPPPPPPMPPQIVPPAALKQFRIAGEDQIMPDDVTKTEIQRSGKDKVVGSWKFCLTAEGAISLVTMLKSTGFSAYDNRITSTIRGEWRYKPYIVAGKPVPICSAVTFIYSQH